MIILWSKNLIKDHIMLFEKIIAISNQITFENEKQCSKLKKFSISEYFKISLFMFISIFAFSLIDILITDFLIFRIPYLQIYYGMFLFLTSSISLYLINKRCYKYFYYSISEQLYNLICFIFFYFIIFIITNLFYFLSGFSDNSFVNFSSYIGISNYSFFVSFLLFINLTYSFFYFSKTIEKTDFNEIKDDNKKIILAKKERDSLKKELLKDKIAFEKMILSLKKEEQYRNNLLNDDSYNSFSDDTFAYLMKIIKEYDNKKNIKHNINEKWDKCLKEKDFRIYNL